MELRQLRYFVRVVDLGSMGRAAQDLGVVTSALSQQISRLEGELATRLLQRSAAGVTPTDAGLAFYRQAQLALRHADDAVQAAQEARLSGHVSIGLPPSSASVLAVPLLRAMHERYPHVRVHLVEILSGHLAALLNARQLDLAVLFDTEAARRWSVMPLLEERLFAIAHPDVPGLAGPGPVRLSALADLPLLLPSGRHGLRAIVDAAFARAGRTPQIRLEIDGLAVLMDAVRAGLGVTIQPGSAATRNAASELRCVPIADRGARRINRLASVSDDELSPAGLAARNVLRDVARQLVTSGAWPGATLLDP